MAAGRSTTSKATPDVAAPDTAAAAVEPDPAEKAPTGDGDQADDKPRSSGTRYLNVSGSVLVYDHDGHSVGAGEWTPEVSLDAVGQAARRRDFLLPVSAL